MTRTVRGTTLLFVLLIFMVAAWFAAPAAQAAYSGSITGGVLTLTGTAGDDLGTVTCDGGNVKVDGLDPSSGAATCASVTAVTVNGLGGNDSVFLDAMNAGSFPALTTQAFSGGAGFDQVVAAPVPGTLDGGVDGDRFYPSLGTQTIVGGSGEDTVFDIATAGATVTDASLVTSTGGTDSLSSVEIAFLTGTNADDVFDSTGFSGGTQINGSNGSDTVHGGPGPDFVIAGSGNDTINGNDGADRLVPNDGNDIVDGGPGFDTALLGDDGMTVTNASATGPFLGSDTLSGFEHAELIAFGPGTIDASGFTGSTKVSGTDGIDTIITGPGADVITARAGNDEIRSGNGPDILRGQVGRDTLIAGAGNDRLIGGPNPDVCNGGPGQDTLNSCP